MKEKEESTKEKNPLVYLFSMLWRFSEGNRRNVVIFWLLFVTAELFEFFCAPITAAVMMDIIQKEGITQQNIYTLLLLLLLMLLTEVVFWAFHGPARILEGINAFIVRKNRRYHLLKAIM